MNSLINGVTLTGIINNSSELVGTIQSTHFLRGTINSVPTITGAIGGPEETYKGSYIVTPKVYPQSLPTKNKIMKSDVSILEIPYYETSNLSGKTVYIGGE